MNNEYKVIPFADVKIGQAFEDRNVDEAMTSFHWVKLSDTSYRVVGEGYIMRQPVFPAGCLVRTADCEPELANIDNPASRVEMTIVRADGSITTHDGLELPKTTAACELDFDTWWDREIATAHYFSCDKHEDTTRELCRTAWENGVDKAKGK